MDIKVNLAETAQEHRDLELSLGREWECACAACLRVKRASLNLLTQLKSAIGLLQAMPISEKDRGIVAAYIRQYCAAIAQADGNVRVRVEVVRHRKTKEVR